MARSTVSLNPLVPPKLFTFDLTRGGVFLPPERRQDDEGRSITSYKSATPYSAVTPGQLRDSIILWLNEYANRLENGMYAVWEDTPQ